jgi:hypothetical protein
MLNAFGASCKPKSNATSFKKGRKKTGGRKVGTPNKTTRSLRELVLAVAEAAGNEVGGDGHFSYMKMVALEHPKSFLPIFADAKLHQFEPDQTSPPGDEILHTLEEVCEHMTLEGVPPEQFALALLAANDRLKMREHSGTAGLASSTDDHSVEDDASSDSGGE